MILYAFSIYSARAIQPYIEDVSRREFLANPPLQDSVIRRIELMGEAAGQLSPAFREKSPEIAWARMRGLRNRMIHGYDDVEMDFVWDTMARHFAAPSDNLNILSHRRRSSGSGDHRPDDHQLVLGGTGVALSYDRKTRLFSPMF